MRVRLLYQGLVCVFMLGASSCYFPEVVLSDAQEAMVKAHILSAAPTPQIKSGAIIGDRVRLIGVDVSSKSVRAGETLTVTYYLEGLSDTPTDTKIFVHFQGRGRGAYQNLDHEPIKGYFPLRQLKRGQLVKDVQTFRVKRGFPRGKAKLYWGLFSGKDRLKIMNPKAVKHDGRNRVLVTTLKIKGSAKRSKAKASALLAQETITIDGALDEPAWSRASWTRWWSGPMGEKSRKKLPLTRAKFMWSPEALYIGVECLDKDIWSTFTDRDSNTWEQEVVEVFVDPDGDHRDYLELQVTPANVVFDARFKHYRSDLTEARAWRYEGWETQVKVEGTLNQREDIDTRYFVEMKLPVKHIPGALAPIEAQHRWRINLFRFDQDKGQRQRAAAFSPPLVPDFHALDAFGEVIFSAP